MINFCRQFMIQLGVEVDNFCAEDKGRFIDSLQTTIMNECLQNLIEKLKM